MLRARTGASDDDYLWCFERVNMVNATRWSAAAALERLPEVQEIVGDRYAVLLGAQVAGLWGIDLLPLRWQGRLAYLPHPSGRSRWYNDPVSRCAAEIFLEELYTDIAPVAPYAPANYRGANLRRGGKDHGSGARTRWSKKR